MFDEIPISTIKLPKRRFQTFPKIFLLVRYEHLFSTTDEDVSRTKLDKHEIDARKIRKYSPSIYKKFNKMKKLAYQTCFVEVS